METGEEEEEEEEEEMFHSCASQLGQTCMHNVPYTIMQNFLHTHTHTHTARAHTHTHTHIT